MANEHTTSISQREKIRFDAALIDKAYGHCDSITAIHSRSFHLASGLLSNEKRKAVRALYAFCRISDDIVDSAVQKQYTLNVLAENDMREFRYDETENRAESHNEQVARQLDAWRHRILRSAPLEDDLVAIAWADARTRYSVPDKYAVQLIDGVARDLHQYRYANFEELAAYCYGVASTVGLMSMHIVGYAGEEAVPYAIKLGVALQITNILRDVAEDYQAGRIYLPQDDLSKFGLSEEDIERGIQSRSVTDKWRAFMQFQIKRNYRLYNEAAPGIKLLDPDGRFAIAAAADLYRGILHDIELHDYNIFARRSHVPTWKKLAMLPGIYWRSR